MVGQGPHYCDEVRKEVNELRDDTKAILSSVHHLDTKVEVLINRDTPPCKELGERIDKLEKTKVAMQNTWALMGIIFGGLAGLGVLITGSIIAWKSF